MPLKQNDNDLYNKYLKLQNKFLQEVYSRVYKEAYGVYTGYSALSFALAIPPEGRVVSCDIDEEMPAIGKVYWQQAGVFDKIELKIGSAKTSLEQLVQNGESGTFDLVFIDADKENYDAYYELGLTLLRNGGIIAVDNALWSGRVADPTYNDESTVAIRALNQKISNDPRVDASLLTLGDGTMLAFKKKAYISAFSQ